MCLQIRIHYKFNTVEAFERAVEMVEKYWGTRLIRGRVIYKGTKIFLNWGNLRQTLEEAIIMNPEAIHGLIVVENR
ncbi:MAG: hypothetical protein HXS53_05900 [Theionarchaea archaeon]|nr:hypothetical protein [Theionarchaea archaeon]